MRAWTDRDTELGYEAYRNQGLRVMEPPEVRALSLHDLQELAGRCGELLKQTYSGSYPLPVGHEEALANTIAAGDLHLFVLTDDANVLAMSGLARIKDLSNDTGTRMWELGRSAENPASPYSSRALLKHRVPWALRELPDTDFLVSATRSPASHHGIRSGRGVQGVWWGGRMRAQQVGDSMPVITTNAAYDYRLGELEPFTSFAIPTQPDRWLKALDDQSIVVPTEEIADDLLTLLAEGTDRQSLPMVKVSGLDYRETDVKLHMQVGPDATQSTRYVATNLVEGDNYSLTDATDQLHKGIGDKVTVESDLTSTSNGVTVMRQLLHEGFTFSGWQPSQLEYGGVALAFARPNPALVEQAVPHAYYPEYFDASGLTGTRRFLERVYATMQRNARNQ